jgi:syntaxin-binding protein 5
MSYSLYFEVRFYFLSADEIHIDEPEVFLSSQKIHIDKKGTYLFYYIFLLKLIYLLNNVNVCLAEKAKEKDRQKLFEESATDSKPRARTTEEIKAKYRKTEVNLRIENYVIYAL